MFVHAALIKRMPAELDFFDYRVPQKLAQSISIGSLIRVPFRSKTELAIVVDIPKKLLIPESDVRDIVDTIHVHPLLTETHLALLRRIADESFSSLATVLNAFIPKKIDELTWGLPTKKNDRQLKNQNYVQVCDTAIALANAIRIQAKKISKKSQALLLAPDTQSAKFLFSLLKSPNQYWHLYDSTLSAKAKTDLWQRIRNGEAIQVIGTRSSLFLPFTNLSQILIYREDDIAYQFIEQRPDLDAIRLAYIAASEYGTALHSCTITPRIEAVEAGMAKLLEQKDVPHASIRIIDKKQFSQKKQQALLPQDLIDFISEQKKPVAILYNKKGYAKQRRCRDCGWEPTCTTCHTAEFIKWETEKMGSCLRCGTENMPPESCPSCGGVRLSLLAPGLLRLSQQLQAALPKKKFLIIAKISSEKTAIVPDVYLATSFATHQIPWNELSAAILLDADMQLSFPDFRTEERFLQRVRWVAARLPQTALCAITTTDPNRPVMHALATNSWQKWFSDELTERKNYSLPPFSQLYIVKQPAKGSYVAFSEIEKRLSNLRTIHKIALTSLPITFKSKDALLVRIPRNAPKKVLYDTKIACAPYVCTPLPLDVNS